MKDTAAQMSSLRKRLFIWKPRDIFFLMLLFAAASILNFVRISHFTEGSSEIEFGNPARNVIPFEMDTSSNVSSRESILPSSMTASATRAVVQKHASRSSEDGIPGIIKCSRNNDKEEDQCCVSWDTSHETVVDEWSTHHPTWEVTYEDEFQFCFTKITNNEKAQLLQKVYDNQFTYSNCSNDIQVYQINAGYGASVQHVVRALWTGLHLGRAVQITKHWPGHRWLFSVENKDHWAHCDSTDMNCYFLPISNCPAIYGEQTDLKPKGGSSEQEKKQVQWIRQFVTRPRVKLRRKHNEDNIEMASMLNTLENNCTAIHVRRGDVGFARHPFRRYAAVKEYLDIGNVTQGETIVLLTDDETTIEEIRKYHATDYTWVFMNRPRNNGVAGGMDGHIPSGDESLEILNIMSEVKLAAKCNKFIHGQSGFVVSVYDELEATGRNFTSVFLDTTVSYEEMKQWRRKADPKSRAEAMLSDIRRKQNKGVGNAIK